MSDFNKWNPPARGFTADRAVAIDAGLRAYMIRVYNYMAGGVALTGVLAWLTFNLAVVQSPGGAITGLTPLGQALFGSPLMWGVMLAPLARVFFLSFRIGPIQAGTARMLFFVYAALVGVSLATIFMVYTHTSITRVFFISAVSFGALSLYGYTTQRDLSGLGSFLIMGLVGVLLAGIVNIFLQSGMLAFVISAVGVLVFAGLTAYDTQNIKEMYDPMDDGTVAGRKAVMGALRLYLDFLNLFLMLLQLLGDRRS
jgi:FtsH-binding integral membrane protein